MNFIHHHSKEVFFLFSFVNSTLSVVCAVTHCNRCIAGIAVTVPEAQTNFVGENGERRGIIFQSYKTVRRHPCTCISPLQSVPTKFNHYYLEDHMCMCNPFRRWLQIISPYAGNAQLASVGTDCKGVTCLLASLIQQSHQLLCASLKQCFNEA